MSSDGPRPAAPADRRALPPAAAPYLGRLRLALGGCARGADRESLEEAFAAARGLVAIVGGPCAGGRPNLEELRRLALEVPEFGAFLSVAAEEADRLVRSASAGLWSGLGLRSAPPGWTPAEREAARMLFACACAPGQEAEPSRLRDGLRALAAGRFAALLCAELGDREEAWVTALGDRYGSVRHRCAPRTAWRSRGLSDLMRADEGTRAAVTDRLARWLAAGGVTTALAGELEAALVHARTPPRFA